MFCLMSIWNCMVHAKLPGAALVLAMSECACTYDYLAILWVGLAFLWIVRRSADDIFIFGWLWLHVTLLLFICPFGQVSVELVRTSGGCVQARRKREGRRNADCKWEAAADGAMCVYVCDIWTGENRQTYRYFVPVYTCTAQCIKQEPLLHILRMPVSIKCLTFTRWVSAASTNRIDCTASCPLRCVGIKVYDWVFWKCSFRFPEQ